MTELYKFDKRAPMGKEERLIVALSNSLNETINTFVRSNFDPSAPITPELFFILRDGVFNFSASIIHDLIVCLYPDQKEKFIEDVKNIFISQLRSKNE